MVCGISDSCWNFGIDFLKIENYFSPRLAILKYPVRNL